MIRLMFFIATVIIGMTSAAGNDTKESVNSKRLTIMSYNVRGGIGMDNVRNHQRTIDVISTESPDIVALQELDSMTARSGNTYLLGEMAQQLNMIGYFAPAIDFDGGKYGIGILCRDHPEAIHRLTLPGREEARAIIVAEFRDFLFACTHLSLTEADRDASAAIINGLTIMTDKPMFLAGDLNSHAEDKTIDILKTQFRIISDTDSPTFPAHSPTETIDYIMVADNSNSVSTISAKTADAPVASDHRPIITTVIIKQ